MKMIRGVLWLGFVLVTGILNGQIVTTDPAVPTAGSAATIFFDATLGTGGLEGFGGDVYAHTGVITTESTSGTDWKYAPSWGDNSEKYKLTRLSENYYSLDITPSVREYYGVPESETILQMAFVFRSADNSLEGKGDGGTDIFVDVFEEGLNVNILQPVGNLVTDTATAVDFQAGASEEALLTLYQNGSEVKSLTASTISHTFNFTDPGDFWLKVTATLNDETVADSVFVHAMGPQIPMTVPAGTVPGINYIDNESVTLALWAPGKESVFVVGDFNNWTPGQDARMFNDGDTYWLTIDGLTPGEEYAYQYLIDETLYLADPYTEKVLDPFNDRWISDETYPGLREYPSVFASGIVSVLQTNQQPYEWKTTSFTPPAREDLVIYELLVRDFIADHDWKTLTDTLDYFSELGINAIELMPFNEFEGNESWGYNPSFYFAPDKYYGPKDDLKAFIDACHARGIAVIQDMVLNHSYSQSPLVQMYFNGTSFKVSEDNPWYNVDSPNPVFSWGYDFNHESQATKDFIDRVNTFWLTEYNVDGFRFDFTKGFTNTPGDGGGYDAARIAILKRMADTIWQVNPDTYVILEHFATNSEEAELSDHGMLIWGNMNHQYGDASMGFHDSNKSDFSRVSYKVRGWNDPHLVGYMESHDEERMMYRNLEFGNSEGSYDVTNIFTALDRVKLASAFFFTIPGPKMIWQFEEVGYDFSIDYDCRVCNKPIRWDYYKDQSRRRVYDVFAALINLKTSEPAFATDDFSLDVGGALKRIELNHSDMDVRIIGNFGMTTNSIDPNFSVDGTWYDFFGGDSISVAGLNDPISLKAGAFRIYTTKRLQKPRITSIPEEIAIARDKDIHLYPVPATEMLYLETANEMDGWEVIGLNGQVLRRSQAQGQLEEIDVTALESGIYILRVSFLDGQTGFRKFVRQ